MSSLRANGAAATRPKARGLLGVLDLAFGFFVWAVHFLTVYVAAALACVLGLAAAGADSHTIFRVSLTVLTVAAAAVVVWHGLRRYRQRHAGGGDEVFRALVAAGSDAIALVAVGWQLFPIWLVPVCA